jgi:L-galactose dehydrogenase/L-glyceraldehyde 3-phosphate reductase
VEYRALGKTGLRVSVLGFGCGNVGGLMIRGARADRERAVARAIELGINYFDTAPSYGDGLSETNLGAALRTLGARVHVGTKFSLAPPDLAQVPAAIARALDASLARLGTEQVDLLQLHSPILAERGRGGPGIRDVLDAIVPALEDLRERGKIRFYGITALGDTDALHQAVGSGRLHTAQVFYNLLNPSAESPVEPGFPGQDFRGLFARARAAGVGVINVRVLAAGALSGDESRHAIAAPSVAPIASGPDYSADVRRARSLEILVRDGHAGSLVEAALRFPLSCDAVSTVLLGYSSLQHLEDAAAAMAKGPLPAAALARLATLWRGFATDRG